MRKMIVSVFVGNNCVRDIELDAEMRVGNLLSGLFPGIDECVVYNSDGELLDKNSTFGDCRVMNGDVLTIRGGEWKEKSGLLG